MSLQQTLETLARTLAARREADPSRSYVASLYAKGEDAILKKVGEEAAEVIIAAKGGQTSQIVHETADLWFHTLVLLAYHGLGPQDVVAELERRMGRSGLEEKASRGHT